MMPAATSNPTPSPTNLKVEHSDLRPIQTFLDSRQHADRLLESLAAEREAILAAAEIAFAAAAASDAAAEAHLATENAASDARLAAEHAAQLKALQAAANKAREEAVQAAEEAVSLESFRAAKQKASYAEVVEAKEEVRQAEIEMREVCNEAEKAEAAEDDARKTLPYTSREDFDKDIAPFRDARVEKRKEFQQKYRVVTEKERLLLAPSAIYDEVCAAKACIVKATEGKQQKALSAAQAVEQAKSAYESAAMARSTARENAAHSRSKARAELKERANAKVEALTREAAHAKAEADADLTALPDSIRTYSRERLQALTQLAAWEPGHSTPKGWKVRLPPVPEPIPECVKAAIIRRELPYQPQPNGSKDTRTDNEGHRVADFRHSALAMQVEVRWADVIDQLVEERERFAAYASQEAACFNSVIPELYRDDKHSLHALAPWSRSPVPVAVQADYIRKLQHLPDHLRGWMLLGSPRAGKTTWVCAWLRDVATFRLTQWKNEAEEVCTSLSDVDELIDFENCEFSTRKKNQMPATPEDLNVWRIQVGKWIDDMGRWKTRDFNDPDVELPAVTTKTIADACDRRDRSPKFRPILWLEELDKVTTSKTNLGWLHNLVDEVYNRRGLIISTTNYNMSELQKLLGDALLERLNGAGDEETDYVIWNLHQYRRK